MTDYIALALDAAQKTGIAHNREDALHKIRSWAEAYPLDVFPEPDWKRANEVLEAAGLSLSCISAGNMRHVITKVLPLVEAALAARPEPSQDREDALRYRWLQDNYYPPSDETDWDDIDTAFMDSSDALDAAIDDARQAPKEPT